MCYDSRRDCLWLANDRIFRSDIQSGNVAKLDVVSPKLLGDYALWREQVYLPDADLVLLMRLFKDTHGRLHNVAWSPKSGKYYSVELPFVEEGKPVDDDKNSLGRSAAMFYDRSLGLVIFHNQREPFFLKVDRQAARMLELPSQGER